MANDNGDMAQLLAQWGTYDDDDDDDISDDDEQSCKSCKPLDADGVKQLDADEVMEKYRREPGKITDHSLDHIMLGCSDLDFQMKAFYEKTGIDPVLAVSLNGCGTKSARVAFEGVCCYLEIVGPDDKQGVTPLNKKLKALPAGSLVPLHYAVRSSKAEELRKTDWKDLGLVTDKLTMVARDKFMPWMWDIYMLGGHKEGGLVPFYIWWGDSVHASSKVPVFGTIDKVKIRAPEDSLVHKLLFDDKGDPISGVSVSTGEPQLKFSFTGPNGTHNFQTSEPMGVEFPGIV
jgi:hypothetical protein